MTEFERLTDFQNLYASMKASFRGKKRKSDEAKMFAASALENIYIMKRQLEQRTYSISPYSEFIVSEPKKRVIKSCAFRDKVLQHCLCDYVLIPKMRDRFAFDNFAGQIGKGTLFGLNRLSEHLVSYFAEYGCDGYILKADISKFFYSINHEIMKRIIAEHFDDDGIRWICNLLIDSTDGDGLPLGNQCSQVFALMYLMSLDDMVTVKFGYKRYGRYMDDFFVIGKSKQDLSHLLCAIENHLSELMLNTNSKTEIVPIKKGIRFLGFHVYLTDDGNVIRKLNGDKKRSTKKKLRKYVALVKGGKMTMEKFDDKFKSIKNHMSHGNCHNLICELDRYVAMLLAE